MVPGTSYTEPLLVFTISYRNNYHTVLQISRTQNEKLESKATSDKDHAGTQVAKSDSY